MSDGGQRGDIIPQNRTDTVFYRRYSVLFGTVNTDVGIGIGILKYPISVQYFGIPTHD